MLARPIDQNLVIYPKRCELKYDGERILVFISDGKINFISRSGKNVKTDKILELIEPLKHFPTNTILDGEIILYDEETDTHHPFGSLGVHKRVNFNGKITYFVFDILRISGTPLNHLPLSVRLVFLDKLPFNTQIKKSNSVTINNSSELETQLNKYKHLEGVILKDLSSIYEYGKRGWHKIKFRVDNLDLLAYGAATGTGKNKNKLSILFLACKDNDKLVYVGKVHSGLTNTNISFISKRHITSKRSRTVIGGEKCKYYFKEPFVVEISCNQINKAGQRIGLRHPVFIGFRDKREDDIENLSDLKNKIK